MGRTDTQAIRLHTLLGNYPNTRALRQGELRSSLVDFDFADVKVPNRAFKSVVRDSAFDVAELAIITFLQAKAYGKPLVLVPARVGPARFQHQCIMYNMERGPLAPSDLAGRRVGVRAWAQTTVTWIRGILAEDYGVDLGLVHWVTFEDAHVAEYRDPPSIERAPEGKDMTKMLLEGEIDAAIIGNELPEDPRIKPLIADHESAAKAWARRRKAVPINHMVVVKESLARSHPKVIKEIYRLLKEARRAGGAVQAGEFDMAPYGAEANRSALEVAIDYSFKQGLIPRRLAVDELFDETTRSL
jgi:4,5-dihydroxyphthalate decarboxylase